MTNYAVIVLAGNSTRFGTSKQFFPVQGKPLVSYTISAFENHPKIDEIILVIREEDRPGLQQIIKQFKFVKVTAMVSGGATRAESVLHGLEVISDREGYVLVHDGARPLVSQELISNLLAELKKSKCVVPFLLQEDATFSLEKNDYIDRKDLFRIQTPQAFETKEIIKLFGEHFDPNALDEASMYRPFGRIGFIQGEKKNIKVTTKEDIAIIEAYLNYGIQG